MNTLSFLSHFYLYPRPTPTLCHYYFLTAPPFFRLICAVLKLHINAIAQFALLFLFLAPLSPMPLRFTHAAAAYQYFAVTFYCRVVCHWMHVSQLARPACWWALGLLPVGTTVTKAAVNIFAQVQAFFSHFSCVNTFLYVSGSTGAQGQHSETNVIKWTESRN